ncbi:TerB N-terminal domain-containing protein [Vibrio viridaestus]|uniref:TerB N-terminal domain-containing protein n=1 Tax=Vibrio viridaestus TaxID=2487322 RepID=UPI0034E0C6A5
MEIIQRFTKLLHLDNGRVILTERCRGAYLDWIASERNNPGTPIGYVFIYFDGLERRIKLAFLPKSVKKITLQSSRQQIKAVKLNLH